MKSINEFNDQELQWVHPNKFKGEYELRGGDEVFVRFHLNGASGSHQIVAETADGNWIIKRKVFGQNITIVAFDSQTELATIKRGMSGQSTLLTLDHREYRWHCTSFWRDVWTWFNNEDMPLLHLIRGSRVQLEPAAHDLPDLALLTTISWYLHKLQEEEATVATIVPIIG
jgi:hypothetical protein